MSYINKEKSSFMPIFGALSLATLVGFAIMYFAFSKMPTDNADADTTTNFAVPAQSQTALKSSHTHV